MDHIISLYQQRFNLKNARFTRIEHEDAMVAIVYKVTQANSAPLILKICVRPHDYAHELYFLKYFADRLPVPRIVDVMQPQTNISGAILMECLPGTLLKVAECTDALAYEVGSLLARIHLNTTTGYGDLTQPQTLSADPRAYFTMKFQEGLSECDNHLPKKLMEQCQTYYDAHVQLLDSVDGPCMTHRDFRAGNLMVHDGKIQGIIDWSSARATFAQEDFCTLERDDWSNNAHNKNSFLAGYASIRPIPEIQKIIPLLRLSKAIAAIGFAVKRSTWKTSAATLYQLNRRFLEKFFGQI